MNFILINIVDLKKWLGLNYFLLALVGVGHVFLHMWLNETLNWDRNEFICCLFPTSGLNIEASRGNWCRGLGIFFFIRAYFPERMDVLSPKTSPVPKWSYTVKENHISYVDDVILETDRHGSCYFCIGLWLLLIINLHLIVHTCRYLNTVFF